MLRTAIVGIVLLAWPALVFGQPTTALDAPKKGTLPNLVSVTAPSARCAALSETHRLLAFGHERRPSQASVSLVRLDDKGTPAAYATTWKLPCPPALVKLGTYPLSLAFHPKLPLLYVWQDTAVTYTNPLPPARPPELTQFDHLLIYDIAEEKPELLAALCRGQDDFLHGQEGAALAFDPSNAFLFVSNLRDPKNAGLFRLGRFPLDADGLPDVLTDAERKLPRPQRLQKLSAKSLAGPLLPPTITPIEFGTIMPGSNLGSAQSMHVVSKDAVLAGGIRGIFMWRPEDKESGLNGLPLKGTNYTLMTGHPDRPLLYATAANTNSIFRVCHADGYPTLFPEQWTIPGASLRSAPVVLKGGKLAVGGSHYVYVMPLDEEGRLLAEVTRIQVFPEVRALVYSPRFDRLYVSVEVSK